MQVEDVVLYYCTFGLILLTILVLVTWSIPLPVIGTGIVLLATGSYAAVTRHD